MWDRIRDWLDNPILIKHIRSRLRRQPVLSSLIVVVLLSLCLAYGGYAARVVQDRHRRRLDRRRCRS